MSEPYIAELRIVGFGYPPKGWARCDGQLLPISGNQALFSIIGTTYGGNGTTNFALPNLIGRVPVHMGVNSGLSPRPIGQAAGAPGVTVALGELPSHNHQVQANNASGNLPSPGGNFWAKPTQVDNLYSANANSSLNQGAVGFTGGSQPHENMQPSLSLMFIIALTGIYPSRSLAAGAPADADAQADAQQEGHEPHHAEERHEQHGHEHENHPHDSDKEVS